MKNESLSTVRSIHSQAEYMYLEMACLLAYFKIYTKAKCAKGKKGMIICQAQRACSYPYGVRLRTHKWALTSTYTYTCMAISII